MYVKPISFLVGGNNMYGVIYLSNVPPPTAHYDLLLLLLLLLLLFKYFYCVVLVMLYLSDGLPQHPYYDMKNYVVIVLINISQSNPSEKIIPNSISIIF